MVVTISITAKNNLSRVPDAIQSGISEMMKALGTTMEEAMKAKIMSNIPPPLAEGTIKQKGHDLALVDTGAMLAQVSSEATEDSVKAGVIGDRAQVAAYQEFGTRYIPERSFMRSTIEEISGQLAEIAETKFKQELAKVTT